MNNSEIEEILDRLGEGEQLLAELSGAFPKWVKEDYDPTSEEIAEIISQIKDN